MVTPGHQTGVVNRTVLRFSKSFREVEELSPTLGALPPPPID
jgi:hypothetical protein